MRHLRNRYFFGFLITAALSFLPALGNLLGFWDTIIAHAKAISNMYSATIQFLIDYPFAYPTALWVISGGFFLCWRLIEWSPLKIQFRENISPYCRKTLEDDENGVRVVKLYRVLVKNRLRWKSIDEVRVMVAGITPQPNALYAGHRSVVLRRSNDTTQTQNSLIMDGGQAEYFDVMSFPNRISKEEPFPLHIEHTCGQQKGIPVQTYVLSIEASGDGIPKTRASFFVRFTGGGIVLSMERINTRFWVKERIRSWARVFQRLFTMQSNPETR